MKRLKKMILPVILGLSVLGVSSCNVLGTSETGTVDETIPTTTTPTTTTPSTSTTTTTETTTETTTDTENECSITFMLDSTTTYKTITITKGSTVEFPEAPTKDNLFFKGWYESTTDSTPFDSSTIINENLTLYAQFTEEVENAAFKYDVYNEGAYITWNKNLGTNLKVAYTLEGTTKQVEIDKELIRNTIDDEKRADILGLPEGEHTISVLDSSGVTLFSKNVEIEEADRSGYAHFNRTVGVGAYNNDGTLKTGAVVVYVTDSTKNTVTATLNGTVYTGLSAILQNQYKSTKPLVIRVLGTINAATWNLISYGNGSITIDEVVGANGSKLTNLLSGDTSQKLSETAIINGGYNSMSNDLAKGITVLKGLTNQISYKNSEFDSYYNMLDISNASNVTVEGVGTDAMLYQFGFTWKNCSSIEVRNLTFDDYTEDACSFEGPDDSTTLAGFTTGNIWVHNNTFNEGKNNWDVCKEQDKHEGDGATDFKKNAYITLSYNHYFNNHKTGLIGGSDSQHTASITFHHNFYDQCTSRLPLARQANMHMYNNYYYKSTGTNMSLRAGAYAFIEACYFEDTTKSIEVKSSGSYPTAAAKVYQCIFTDKATIYNGTKVETREKTVTNGNIYGSTFDTDSTIFYYDSSKKVSNVTYLTDAETAKQDCINYAGVLK